LVALTLAGCGEEPQSVQDLSPGYTVAEATTAVIDAYGNEGMRRTLDLAMDRATMERINYDRITIWGLLNLTTPTIHHPLGQQMIAEYCQDDDARRYSTDFCLGALM
jgi:hypothetical protein